MMTFNEDRAPSAKDINEATDRFKTDGRSEGINGEDFLKLCDHYDLKVAPKLREHIQNHVLQVNLSFVRQNSVKTRYSIVQLIKPLWEKVVGIVPEEQLKLRIQMVPKPLHRRNLRLALGAARWTALRGRLLQERAHVCETCASAVENTSELHAHEEWEYDLKKRPNRARLMRISLACRKCHGVEHFGNSMALVKEGRLPPHALDELGIHFCQVNQVSGAMWDFHVKQAFDRWEQISRRISWEIDLGDFARLLTVEELKALQPSRSTSKSIGSYDHV